MENKTFNIKPTLVLALITAVVTLMLAAAQHIVTLNAEDESVLSGKLKDICATLMGDGEFEVVLNWLETGYETERPRHILKLIIKDDNSVAFQILTKGYNKDGLNILVAMNSDGSVKNLAVVENKETKGIGEKIEPRSFLDNFIGKSSEVRIIKGQVRHENEIAAVTTATKSSVGVANAVNIAIETYQLLFGG